MSELWPGQGGPSIDYISGMPSAEYRAKKKRGIAILGSTGSIGRSTLEIIASRSHAFSVTGLACARNARLLAEQAMRWRPPMLAVLNEEYRRNLLEMLPESYKPRIVTGSLGYALLASAKDADIVVGAQVGSAGLPGVLAAALSGKAIALANKESLVLAGSLLRKSCRQSGAAILPLDSEHYAVFQCSAGRSQTVKGIILTASGGPFRGMGAAAQARVKAADALKHPNWSMGDKITIDSATLMNKGLEVIEAMHLYGLKARQVDVLVHPQSVIHSFVCLADNSQLAQFAVPDMRLPIADCLLWPECDGSFIKPLNLAEYGQLTFTKPDTETFPCLGLALKAASLPVPQEWAKIGLNPACIVLNGANEAAVEFFLHDQCGFCDIPLFIEDALHGIQSGKPKAIRRDDLSPAERAVEIFSVIADLDAQSRERVRKKARF